MDIERNQKPKNWKKLYTPEINRKRSKALMGRKLSLKTRQKMSKARIGKKLSSSHKKKISLNNARFWKGKHRNFSEAWKKKIRQNALGSHHPISLETRKRMSESSPKGSSHWNWKGGLKQRSKHNTDFKYKVWREKVFQRDNFTCQACKQKGERLEAHHIKSWAKFPKMRYQTINGITLCKSCHKKIHSICKEVDKQKLTVKETVKKYGYKN